MGNLGGSGEYSSTLIEIGVSVGVGTGVLVGNGVVVLVGDGVGVSVGVGNSITSTFSLSQYNKSSVGVGITSISDTTFFLNPH